MLVLARWFRPLPYRSTSSYLFSQMPLIQELNVDQLKVPLGFIKIPQLVSLAHLLLDV